MRDFRRAFSLIEVVVVVSVVALLSGVLLLQVSRSSTVNDDAVAKASLVVFQKIQENRMHDSDTPLDAPAILAGSYDRGGVGFDLTESTSPSTVAVLVSGSVTIGAARSGNDCWGLRMDFNPTSLSPLQLWLIAVDQPFCLPSLFTDVTVPTDGSGLTPSRPSLLD